MRYGSQLASSRQRGVDDDCRDEFAAHGMSRRTAEQIFVRETGLAPARWRRLAQLSRGLASLAEGKDIDAAAELSGYRSRSGFFEAISQTFGMAPSEARPKAGETESW